MSFGRLEVNRSSRIIPTSQPHVTLSISLLPVLTGTRILWASVFEDPKIVAAIRHIAEPGAEQNLDRLQMHLRGELT